MLEQLTPQVALHIVPTKQFRTIEINFHFIEPITAQSLSARSLLASVLESRSKDFANQAAMAEQLANLYGADFDINVSKNGEYSFLTVRLRLVDPQYLPDHPDLVTAGLHFIYQVLQRPYLTDGHFDEQLVQREQANLLAYLHSVADDKQFYANLMVQAKYYQTAAQRTPSFGDAKLIAKLTNADLVQAYQHLFTTNKIEIEVLGDVTKQQILTALTDFKWPNAEINLPTIFYQQPLQPLQNYRLYLPNMQQAKLAMAYRVPAHFYQNDNYPAWLVTNALFGGTPMSMLFLHVREQQHLAYYADSTLDPFCGALLVQSGIDSDAYEKTVAMIQQQVQNLATGNFDQQLLVQNQQSLINDFVTHLDSPRYLLNRVLYSDILQQLLPDATTFKQMIMAVDQQQVQACAQQMQLQVQLCVMNEENK